MKSFKNLALILLFVLFLEACSTKINNENKKIKVEIISDSANYQNYQDNINNFFKILHQKGEVVKAGIKQHTSEDDFIAWIEETESRNGTYNLWIHDNKTREKYIAYTLNTDNPNIPDIDSFGNKIVILPIQTYDEYYLYDVSTKQSLKIDFPREYEANNVLLFEDNIISIALAPGYSSTEGIMVYNLKTNNFNLYKIRQDCEFQKSQIDNFPKPRIHEIFISQNGNFYWNEENIFYSVPFKDLEYINGC